MIKKLSSYQKLKKEVASLRADLRELVLNPNSFESQIIKSDITFIDEMEKHFFGSGDNNGKAKGLMNWANNVKPPQRELKLLSDLSDENKPVLGEYYLDGTIILECVELPNCSECYLNAVKQNTGLPHTQCEKSGCGTRIFEKGRYSYILGFIRKCSAWKEDI